MYQHCTITNERRIIISIFFSERKLLPEPIEKTATRNMFYDEQGKHIRTKKEILEENGDVRKGCKIVKKGEVYERTLFTAKNKLFKQEDFVDEVKHFYTDFINLLVKDDKEKLHVFGVSWNGMDFRMYMIFTKPLPVLKQLMPNIGTARTDK